MLKRRLGGIAFGAICLLSVSMAYAQGLPSCAILTFDARLGVSVPESQALTDIFATEFDRLGAYRLMPRIEMRRMLDEQRFLLTDHCAANDCAIQAGRLLGVRFVVYGTITLIDNDYSLETFVVDVETGLHVGTARTDFASRVGKEVRHTLYLHAQQLCGRWPLTDLGETVRPPPIAELSLHPLPSVRTDTRLKSSERNLWVIPRLGLSSFTLIAGIEIQIGHISLSAGTLGTHVAGGIRYYARKAENGWFVGVCGGTELKEEDEGEKEEFFYGAAIGYRWFWTNRVCFNAAIGPAVTIEPGTATKQEDRKYIPAGELAIGFFF